jgi:hypothetical protein
MTRVHRRSERHWAQLHSGSTGTDVQLSAPGDGALSRPRTGGAWRTIAVGSDVPGEMHTSLSKAP